jgi:hypothetical protein
VFSLTDSVPRIVAAVLHHLQTVQAHPLTVLLLA